MFGFFKKFFTDWRVYLSLLVILAGISIAILLSLSGLGIPLGAAIASFGLACLALTAGSISNNRLAKITFRAIACTAFLGIVTASLFLNTFAVLGIWFGMYFGAVTALVPPIGGAAVPSSDNQHPPRRLTLRDLPETATAGTECIMEAYSKRYDDFDTSAQQRELADLKRVYQHAITSKVFAVKLQGAMQATPDNQAYYSEHASALGAAIETFQARWGAQLAERSLEDMRGPISYDFFVKPVILVCELGTGFSLELIEADNLKRNVQTDGAQGQLSPLTRQPIVPGFVFEVPVADGQASFVEQLSRFYLMVSQRVAWSQRPTQQLERSLSLEEAEQKQAQAAKKAQKPTRRNSFAEGERPKLLRSVSVSQFFSLTGGASAAPVSAVSDQAVAPMPHTAQPRGS